MQTAVVQAGFKLTYSCNCLGHQSIRLIYKGVHPKDGVPVLGLLSRLAFKTLLC